jgi:NADH-quinone oxidoreductase subunit M
MPTLLLLMLVLPLVGAIVAAVLGPSRGDAVRWTSLVATVASLVLAAVLAVNFASLQRAEGKRTFLPEFVPGAPGLVADAPGDITKTHEDVHATSWDLLPLAGRTAAPASAQRSRGAIQFYVGIDGLNVWLLVLTALLMVSAVLVSWTVVTERVNEYYAWLLALGTGMLGVFLAFDVVLFYVFFELTLVPLFFLIGIWGGPERQHAARKFFIFTLTGSLLTMLGVLAIVLVCYDRGKELTFSMPRLVEIVQAIRTDTAHLSDHEMTQWLNIQRWIFLALMAGFAIKVPLVPLHTWLPLAHVEAPTAGSVLLAGVLLKIGAYGFLRLCLPLVPDASVSFAPFIGTLAVIGIIYGAFCALSQEDIKKLVAYSSVSHLGFCMLGMFALTTAGLTGSLLQMINHGLSTGALFLLVGMLYERYHTRKMADYGGMAARLKLLGFFMVFICLTSAGLPGLNGFVGEVLVLMGAFDSERLSTVLAAVAVAGIVLGAWYLLTMLLRVFFGPVKEPGQPGGHGWTHVNDLNARELAALLPIAAVCIALGVYPQPVIDASQRDVQLVADIVKTASGSQRAATPAETEKQVAGEVRR